MKHSFTRNTILLTTGHKKPTFYSKFSWIWKHIKLKWAMSFGIQPIAHQLSCMKLACVHLINIVSISICMWYVLAYHYFRFSFMKFVVKTILILDPKYISNRFFHCHLVIFVFAFSKCSTFANINVPLFYWEEHHLCSIFAENFHLYFITSIRIINLLSFIKLLYISFLLVIFV